MRFSTTYNNTPKTFRRGSEKIFDKYGGNAQNWAKSIRKIFIPDGFDEDIGELVAKCKYWLETGDTSLFTEEELVRLKCILQVDQSGAEALIVAYDCRIGAFRDLFIYGIKPHVYVAMKLFPEVWKRKIKEHRIPMDEDDFDILYITPINKLRNNPHFNELDKLIKASDNWSYDERYYYYSKQTCHSANYGIEWNKFRYNVLEKSGGRVVLSKDDAKRFLKVYRELFPEIVERNYRVRDTIVDQNRGINFPIIYNFFGHPYTITNYNISENTYKEYYAWGPQSTVGEITRTAYVLLQNHIEENEKKWDILLDCHDSYAVQTSLIDVKEASMKMKELMNVPLVSPFDGTKFSMKSDLQVGFNLSPYKSKENELGLRELEWI